MRPNPAIRRSAPLLVATLLLASLAATGVAQEQAAPRSTAAAPAPELSGVRLFNSWVADAVFTPGIDLEPLFDMQFYDGGDLWFGGARTAIWVAEGVELGGRLGWGGFDPDSGDGESGFADLELFGRYRLPLDFGGTAAAGAQLLLPTGEEEAGQDNTIVRIFGALRQDMGGAFTFTGNLGFEYMELFGEDGNGIALGLGSLVPISEELTAVFEFNLRTAFEYAIFTAGADYELPPGGHLRGAFGLGLDSEAPDAQFQLALALPVF